MFFRCCNRFFCLLQQFFSVCFIRCSFIVSIACFFVVAAGAGRGVGVSWRWADRRCWGPARLVAGRSRACGRQGELLHGEWRNRDAGTDGIGLGGGEVRGK